MVNINKSTINKSTAPSHNEFTQKRGWIQFIIGLACLVLICLSGLLFSYIPFIGRAIIPGPLLIAACVFLFLYKEKKYKYVAVGLLTGVLISIYFIIMIMVDLVMHPPSW